MRRVVGDAPIFGMHYSLAKPGAVALGDKVPQIKIAEKSKKLGCTTALPGMDLSHLIS